MMGFIPHMKSITSKIVSMLAALSLALVTTGSAQDNSAPKAPSKAALKKYDADKDGKLSEEEIAKKKADAKAKRDEAKKAALEKYDADKSGKLEADEKAKKKADHAAQVAARKAEKEAKKAEKEAKKAEKEAKKAANQAADGK